MSQLNKYLNKAEDYLEAIMHDAPPISREQWDADKAKKKALSDVAKQTKKDKIYKDAQSKPQKNTSPAKLRTIANKYVKMGIDMARDHLYDDPDVDKFKDWADTAAGEAAYSLTQYMSGTEQLYYELIKNGGVQDVEGWIADYIHDGMLKALSTKKKK